MEFLKSHEMIRSKSPQAVKLGLQLSKVGPSYPRMHYVMQGLKQKVGMSSIQTPEVESEVESASPSSSIKSLVRTEAWGHPSGRLRLTGEPRSLSPSWPGSHPPPLQRGRRGTLTWPKDVFQRELDPGRKSGHGVLQTVVEEEGVQGQALGVAHGRDQVLRVVEQRQRAHVPVAHRRAGYV